jgi:site-specific DNA-methyltransferase (adenine-specific)
MKQLNGGKQMKDVWTLPAIAKWEKSCKKHPTQKPLSVLTRIILASTKPNAWVLDPFTGSSTTGIAANLANRRFLGIDQEKEFLEISKCRKIEIENIKTAEIYRNKIRGFNNNKEFDNYIKTEPKPKKKIALGFCRIKDIANLINDNRFYFHAIENNNVVQDFPLEIFEAEYLYTYEGGRGKPIRLTGHYGKIKSIKQIHKSKIKGKEKSKTEFYWEIKLDDNFKFDNNIIEELKLNKIFKNNDINKELIKKYLPAIVEKDRII